MVSKLDESVGKVIEALNAKNMLENSVILFMSDNGAPTVGIYATTGSNYPFRGVSRTITKLSSQQKNSQRKNHYR